jgi:hypothetical protein
MAVKARSVSSAQRVALLAHDRRTSGRALVGIAAALGSAHPHSFSDSPLDRPKGRPSKPSALRMSTKLDYPADTKDAPGVAAAHDGAKSSRNRLTNTDIEFDG